MHAEVDGLGASLARLEIGVMFEQIWRRLPGLCVVGEPEPLRSDFLNGIKRMPCAWTSAVWTSMGAECRIGPRDRQT
jgi:hypothetical protein